MKNIKKAQKGYRAPKTAKDSMMMYGRMSDSLATEALMKGPKAGAKDLKAAKEARGKESKIAKRLYGTTPSGRYQAGGVAGKQPKAGMVDPKGAYTKVQMRTLGNMKKGGKMVKRSKKK